MSFAFFVDRPEDQEWSNRGETPLRTIKRASLYDVSIVTTPAYDGTEIALRSLEAARGERCETAQEFRLRMKRKLIR
jgi:phage head maturation protease